MLFRSQVLKRRFSNEEFKFWPDIVLVDGGKSQLSVVSENIPQGIYIIGISKGKRFKRKGGRLLDEFWINSGEDVQKLEIENKAILIELRDEAHRFAITHHRKARSKSGQRSVLESIPGVGVATRKSLIEYFGNIENIKKANDEEIGRAHV